jgi:hypothetical protein
MMRSTALVLSASQHRRIAAPARADVDRPSVHGCMKIPASGIADAVVRAPV